MTWRTGILLFLSLARAVHAAAPAGGLHAGPVYTAAKSNSEASEGDTPLFPILQVLLDPPEGAPALRADALRLRIDGQDCGAATRIEPFSASGHALAAAIVIDVSGSMRGGPLNAIRAGLLHFVDDAGKSDRVLIETVADESRTDSAWTASGSQLRAAIQGLAARGQLTRLWDGLDGALRSFGAHPSTRRLTLISDGHDEGSQHTEDQIIAEAVSKRIPVDAIGVTRSSASYLKNLEKLAAATGGQFRRAANEQQLEQLVGSGIKRIKGLPLATFEAKDVEADGKLHNFKIIWRPASQEIDTTFSAVLPEIKSIWTNLWLWVALAGTVLIIIAAFSFLRRPKQTGAYIPVASGTAAAFAPQPEGVAPASPFKPAAPRPFVPAAVSPAAISEPEFEAQPLPDQRRVLPKAKTQYASRFDSAPGGPAAWLFCEDGPLMGLEYPVDAAEFWIGALDNNHLCMTEDPTVSANHACIVSDHGILGIVDYNSTNGTRVNDQVIGPTRQLLQPGDRIRIGRSLFVLRSAQTRAADL